MNLLKHVLGIVCMAVAGLAGAGEATYPTKPIRLVVVYPAGGGVDIIARALGQQMTETLGQQFVVDNQVGAGTTIGAAVTARANPDGYTILMTDVSFSISPNFYPNLPYDPVKSFAPVGLVNLVTDVIAVYAGLPMTTMKDFVAYAKANPGKILYASAGNGTINHLAPELLKVQLGIDLVHVPYKGAIPALTDVLSGRTHMYLGALASTAPHIRSGKLKAIAITGKKRSPMFPDVPTVAETVLPDYDISAWYGMLAPAGTPKAVIDRLNAAMRRGVQTKEVLQHIADQGGEPVGSTPEAFEQFLAVELKKWTAATKASGAKPE
mgnify:CR=1 FL=1